jgi:Immunoglobulin-like domain of bacterial spore germination.
MKKNILIIIIFLAVVTLAIAGYLFFNQKSSEIKLNANIANDNLPNDNADASKEQKLSAHFHLVTPVLDAEVKSPLQISGSAAGWYFEAVFPVRLLDANGKVLASGQARATDDWMTENFVPFTVELSFSEPATPTGMLIFKNDNPSGDPSRDEEVDVPVHFSVPSTAACRPTGCSGQICSDADVITDCIYLPEYACYKNAKCEKQSNGKCGWTQTSELTSCINKSKK